MSELIADVIKILGTAALVVIAAAWLTKSIITHILSRKVEVYKSELKRESDKEVERLKSNLQIAALERQIVFSKLHEKRGLVMAECYALLRTLSHSTFSSSLSPTPPGEPNPKAESVREKIVQLREHFYKYRIFFSEEICSVMDEFIVLLMETVDSSYLPSENPEENREWKEKSSKRFPELIKKVQNLQESLEKEFRGLLGVTSSTSTMASNIIDGGQAMADSQDQKLKVYEQLCTSYRAIDDFRAKLLGFLPLATGTGIFLLLGLKIDDVQNLSPGTKSLFVAVGAFGFFITLGLFLYEIYGIKKCHALLEVGRHIEDSLKLKGQFNKRPQNVLYVINEPCAAGIIYPTVLAAWTFFTLVFASPKANPWIPIFIFIVGLACTLIYDLILRRVDTSSAVNTQEETC
jgi:hypothetical protein